MDCEKLGQLILQLRKEKGLTQRELSLIHTYTKNYINPLEMDVWSLDLNDSQGYIRDKGCLLYTSQELLNCTFHAKNG